MAIQHRVYFSEIVSAAAAVITLACVALQIKQTSTATHRQMYIAAASGLSDYWRALAQDYSLYELFVSMLRSPGELSRTEKGRACIVMDSCLTLMESYYPHNPRYGGKLSPERWERIPGRMFSTPGGAEYWQRRRFAYHDEVTTCIDALLSPPGGSARLAQRPLQSPRTGHPAGLTSAARTEYDRVRLSTCSAAARQECRCTGIVR